MAEKAAALSAIRKIPHWINGQVHESDSDRFGEVFDSATGEQCAEVVMASEADVDAAIENALRQATISLEGMLRDQFARVDATDVFFISQSMLHPASSNDRDRDIERRVTAGGVVPSATLHLSRGGVVSVTSAFASYTQAGLSDATTRTDLTTILNGDSALMLDEPMGLLRIVDYALSNQYIELQYLAGILNDDGCPATYEGVPDWLEELATLQASIILNANPQVRNEALPADELASLKELRNSIVLDHARYAPMSFKPRDISTVASAI